MSAVKKKLKGRAATGPNKIAYAREIAKMESIGEKFPTNNINGGVNVLWFADRCEFGRSVIEGKGALAEQFETDVKRIGLVTKSSEDVDALTKLKKKADEKTHSNNELTKTNNLQQKEIENLQKLVARHEKTIRELRHGREDKERSLEHLLATGERFLL